LDDKEEKKKKGEQTWRSRKFTASLLMVRTAWTWETTLRMGSRNSPLVAFCPSFCISDSLFFLLFSKALKDICSMSTKRRQAETERRMGGAAGGGGGGGDPLNKKRGEMNSYQKRNEN